MRIYCNWFNQELTTIQEVTDFKTGKRRVDLVVQDNSGKEIIHKVGLFPKYGKKYPNKDFLTRSEAVKYALALGVILY